MNIYLLFPFALIGLLFSCSNQETIHSINPKELYTIIGTEVSGIDFRNDLKETIYMNGLFYEYFYNGAGVATGDFNNDGLVDIYFVSNLNNNHLYLNQGDLKFSEIGVEAGVTGAAGFPTGVTTVDINNDGWLDIYICASGKFRDPEKRRNELYINLGANENGIPLFEEKGASFGLNIAELSTQASFFDYDRDGDLDLFLINHDVDIYGEEKLEEYLQSPGPLSGERLYRNDDGQYRNITKEAGIIDNRLSYGLGLAIGDINNDEWPDIYVGHDFSGEDHLYINNGDGTFSEKIKQLVRHISNFSMGNDIADINNDGWLDLMTVDMVSEDNYGIKTSMSGMNPEIFYRHVNLGLHHQYMFNTLQLNNGKVDNNHGPFFSEIAHLGGVSNTDWSWAPLFFDMDLDGDKDLFIGNGIKRDFRNNDFVKYHKELRAELTKQKQIDQQAYINDVMARMPERKKNNYFFVNNNDLTFTKIKNDSISKLTCSNGSAYADFDNDGDLDIIVNNMDDFAFIYKNNSIENQSGNYLKISLRGSEKNRLGIGTKIIVTDNNRIQFIEQQLTRGFQSSVPPGLHFGMGHEKIANQIKIIWPDGKKQKLFDIPTNQELVIDYKEAIFDDDKKDESQYNTIFEEVPPSTSINYRHTENDYDDFEHESLLPHRMSQFGPALSIGDVNGDGFEDVFLGGAMSFSGALFLQDKGGNFRQTQHELFQKDQLYEDVDATFFDADQDGDLDLYVVSGGNERTMESPYYQDRLYENVNGKLQRASQVLPPILQSGGCVEPYDYDRDGDLDLFVGGRQIPGQYPYPANSYLLQNNSKPGSISFTDVTNSEAMALLEIGMITDAIWVDVTGDQVAELILSGEWMPLTILQYQDGKFNVLDKETNLEEETGWWFSIAAADFDQDGDMDLVGGNLGLNYKYKASMEEPFEIYATDFDETGSIDIVLGYYNQGELYPLRGRECSSSQMPFIKKKFPTYDAYGKAKLSEIYDAQKLENAIRYQANNFATCYFENVDNGRFRKVVLDNYAQLSSTNAIVTHDFNGDNHLDLLFVGNLYGSEVETPRNDASYGAYLEGDGKGNFEVIRPFESGLYAQGDVRNSGIIQLANGDTGIILAANNDQVQLIKVADANL